MPTQNDRIEAAARAMWEWMADVQDGGVRYPCFHVPIDHEGAVRLRDAPALRWEKAEGAWRNDMLTMAAVAWVALENDED
jgi:hypothetical protein